MTSHKETDAKVALLCWGCCHFIGKVRDY